MQLNLLTTNSWINYQKKKKNFFFLWKSKEEINATLVIPGNSFTPKVAWIHNVNIEVKYQRNILKQSKVSFTHRDTVNVFIVNELNTCLGDFQLGHFLLGAVETNKNANFDTYGYSC